MKRPDYPPEIRNLQSARIQISLIYIFFTTFHTPEGLWLEERSRTLHATCQSPFDNRNTRGPIRHRRSGRIDTRPFRNLGTVATVSTTALLSQPPQPTQLTSHAILIRSTAATDCCHFARRHNTQPPSLPHPPIFVLLIKTPLLGVTVLYATSTSPDLTPTLTVLSSLACLANVPEK
jgi:hypothetical protein